MQNDDKLLSVRDAVAQFKDRLPFLDNEDKAWRAIRDGHVPSIPAGRRRYLSTAKLEALARGEKA